MKSKADYREYVKELRGKITENEKRLNDNNIYTKVIQSNEYKKARCIFIYVSYKNEVDTHNIIKKALKEGKSVCVPKIISLKEGMKAVKITSFDELKESKYGMLEPDLLIDNVIEPEKIDLAYLPGVAFDLNGGRIGYGGGFYDRFLYHIGKNVPKIALAYSFQIFDHVPMSEYDVYVDSVITDQY
jgi:5-formyltetrahydrofolate cyclo-ligase